jgi:p-cumate 2,3-dioxygenase alpha subunit
MCPDLFIFPNLVLNDIMSITVRVFSPPRPTTWSQRMVAGARGRDRQAGAVTAVVNFLESSAPEVRTPDDIEALESCQRAAAAAAEAPWNDLSKGFDASGDDAIGDTKDELPQRAFGEVGGHSREKSGNAKSALSRAQVGSF